MGGITLVKDETAESADRSAAATGRSGRAGRVAGWLQGWRADATVLGGYLVVAIVAMKHLLTGPLTAIAAGNTRGQAFDEWMLVHGAQLFSRGENPFYTGQMGFPDGVHPIAVHGFPGLSVPLAPLTLWLGPTRTYALAATLCLVATAYAWYHVLYRHLVRGRAAAVIGGALGGLGPTMVSHAQGDLSRAALFLVPFLIWLPIRLRGDRAWRTGVLLAMLAAWQLLIDEEVLFLALLGWVAFLVGYGLQRRHGITERIRPYLPGLAVTAATWVVLCAYPLITQFFGPQPAQRAPSLTTRGADLFSFFAFPTPSLGTWPVGQLHYASVGTDQNGFYGWPLVLLLLGALVVLRTRVVRALAGAAVVLAVLSLGDHVVAKTRNLHVPGPWRLIGDLPGLRAIPPVDIALAVFPMVVLIVALLVREGMELARRIQVARPQAPALLAWYGVLTAALLPIAPAPVRISVVKVPPFVTEGIWHRYVPAGGSLLTILPGATRSAAWRWAASTDLELPFAGVDLGPALRKAADTGKAQKVTDRDRADARAALRLGHVAAVVLERQGAADPLRVTANMLLGTAPDWVGGVWVWDVREMSGM